MAEFKKRFCESCGKEFSPFYASQVACSKECKRVRKILQDREYRLRHKAFVERLVQEVESLKKRVAELENLLKDKFAEKDVKIKADTQVSTSTKPSQKAQKAKPVIKSDEYNMDNFEFCERMSLKMKKLPCGEHDRCWRPEPCEKTKGKKRVVNPIPKTGYISYESLE